MLRTVLHPLLQPLLSRLRPLLLPLLRPILRAMLHALLLTLRTMRTLLLGNGVLELRDMTVENDFALKYCHLIMQ